MFCQFIVVQLIFVTCNCLLNTCKTKNNECSSFKYLNPKDLCDDSHCYYDPTIYMTAPQIGALYGCKVLNYTVVTEDGYILTVFRIPHECSKSRKRSVKKKEVVLLQHGFGNNCATFLGLGDTGLAMTLANAGYDVWLGNFRGNMYSNRHVNLSNTDPKFWDFTFEEHGLYDLPAQIELAARTTNQKVFYIGYSMGTSAFFVLNSLKPPLVKKYIRVGILMAPIAFLGHTKTIIKYLTFPPLVKIAQTLLNTFTDGGLQIRTPEAIKKRSDQCLPYRIEMNVCLFGGYTLGGFDYSQQTSKYLPFTVMQEYDAITVKNLVHFAQLIWSGQFKRFDYGPVKNKQRYGSIHAPEYDLLNVNVPIWTLRGPNDLLATEKNTQEVLDALPESVKVFTPFLVDYERFSHGDFSEGKDAKELVYNYILKFLKVNASLYY